LPPICSGSALPAPFNGRPPNPAVEVSRFSENFSIVNPSTPRPSGQEVEGSSASGEEGQAVFSGCQFELAAFYEPAVDMKEWL